MVVWDDEIWGGERVEPPPLRTAHPPPDFKKKRPFHEIISFNHFPCQTHPTISLWKCLEGRKSCTTFLRDILRTKWLANSPFAKQPPGRQRRGFAQAAGGDLARGFSWEEVNKKTPDSREVRQGPAQTRGQTSGKMDPGGRSFMTTDEAPKNELYLMYYLNNYTLIEKNNS